MFVYGCNLIAFGTFLLKEVAFDLVPEPMSTCPVPHAIQTPQRTHKEPVSSPSVEESIAWNKMVFQSLSIASDKKSNACAQTAGKTNKIYEEILGLVFRFSLHCSEALNAPLQGGATAEWKVCSRDRWEVACWRGEGKRPEWLFSSSSYLQTALCLFNKKNRKWPKRNRGLDKEVVKIKNDQEHWGTVICVNVNCTL